MKFRFLELFLAKFLILAYISLKIGYFELGHDYDVTVTSYLGCWYLFWYVWKEETPSYTMVPIRCILGVSFSSSKGGGNHPPLVRRVTKKGLVRRGLKAIGNPVRPGTPKWIYIVFI